jgi:hypothetical protein
MDTRLWILCASCVRRMRICMQWLEATDIGNTRLCDSVEYTQTQENASLSIHA